MFEPSLDFMVVEDYANLFLANAANWSVSTSKSPNTSINLFLTWHLEENDSNSAKIFKISSHLQNKNMPFSLCKPPGNKKEILFLFNMSTVI